RDWSSDVCSSDLTLSVLLGGELVEGDLLVGVLLVPLFDDGPELVGVVTAHRKGDGADARVAALRLLAVLVAGGTARGHQRDDGCGRRRLEEPAVIGHVLSPVCRVPTPPAARAAGTRDAFPV